MRFFFVENTVYTQWARSRSWSSFPLSKLRCTSYFSFFSIPSADNETSSHNNLFSHITSVLHRLYGVYVQRACQNEFMEKCVDKKRKTSQASRHPAAVCGMGATYFSTFFEWSQFDCVVLCRPINHFQLFHTPSLFSLAFCFVDFSKRARAGQCFNFLLSDPLIEIWWWW